MDDLNKDSRFSHITKDARFRKMSRREKKVKIDKRFQSMFHDKRFQLKTVVDKRGRPQQNISGSEHLERYYDLSSSSDESTDQENATPADVKSVDEEDILAATKSSRKSLPPDIKDKLKDLTVDYARGEARILTDSSSDEESDSGPEDEDFEHGWGELDKDAETTDDVTARLALCNVDWDRISAQDLAVLFNSFLPPGGSLLSVTIYPSEFGLKRMAEEDMHGPPELTSQSDSKDKEAEDEMSLEQRERLRKYQLNRLKYYYAVLHCDSANTANHIYSECDGLEYESSMNRLDLRFIPDGTEFDQTVVMMPSCVFYKKSAEESPKPDIQKRIRQNFDKHLHLILKSKIMEPRETCTELPDLTTYKPRLFRTTALTQVKVDLTWDETDPARQEAIRSLHSGKGDNQNLNQFLASSSDEEEGQEEEPKSAPVEAAEEGVATGKGSIKKYKALLADLEKAESKKKDDVSMEVSWDLKLEQRTAESVKKTLNTNDKDTPFEKFLNKKKDKLKKKKEEKTNKSEQKNEDEAVEPFSDDDLPSDVDLNDPFFRDELEAPTKKNKVKNKKANETTKTEEEKQKEAELELLMMDEVDEGVKKHFSLKKIEDSEKLKKKKKFKKGKDRLEQKTATADDFQMDVKDDRFSAIFSSHHYNVDPAEPQFRSTAGMKALIAEKQRRVIEPSSSPEIEVKKKGDAELNLLVKSVKRKAEQVIVKRKKKLS